MGGGEEAGEKERRVVKGVRKKYSVIIFCSILVNYLLTECLQPHGEAYLHTTTHMHKSHNIIQAAVKTIIYTIYTASNPYPCPFLYVCTVICKALYPPVPVCFSRSLIGPELYRSPR